MTRALTAEELLGGDTALARRAAFMRRHDRALCRTARDILRNALQRESSSPSSSEKEKP